MVKKGIRDELGENKEDLSEGKPEAENVVRVKEEDTNEFYTMVGERHGCCLSPILFVIYTAIWRTC